MVLIEEVVETPPPSPPRLAPPPSPPASRVASKANGVLNEKHFGSYDWSEEIALACDNFRSPFVFWAQDGDSVFLKIDVQDAANPRIKIAEHSVDVLTEATGASGVTIYRSHIDLLNNVVEKESSFLVLSNHIDIKLSKYSKADWWSRLSSDKSKLPWLKIDFDRWKNEDDDEEEEEAAEQDRLRREMMASSAAASGKNYGEEAEGFSNRLAEQVEAAEFQAKQTLKNIYLLLYNAVMFIGFSYVFWSLSYRMYVLGPDVYQESVDRMGTAISVLQVVAWLEIIHALVGLVRTNVWACVAQQWGRSFILFFVILAHEGLAESPHVHWLFFVWSAIEIVRYPYYMLNAADQQQNKMMTWLRYSAWIPLYPAGMMLEMSIINASIPLFELSGKFSVDLSADGGWAFRFGTFLRAYLLLYPVVGFWMLWHMWIQRKKALGGSGSGSGGKNGGSGIGAKRAGGVAKAKRKTA